MYTPKSSVIVPVYNVEIYLPRCIDSILSQSFTDFELILVDDGSPDNCGKICDEYALKDSRVRVFHKSNGGVSSARNLGLDHAIGEWVTFIDSDDHVDVDYLQELMSFTKSGKTDWIITLNSITKYTNSKSLPISYDDYNRLFTQYELDKNGYVIGKLYKREIINSIHLRFKENIHLGEDMMFALIYLQETKNVVLISSDKYFYDKQRPGSLTKTLNPYKSELAGKEEFDRIVSVLRDKFNLDKFAITELEKSQKYYTERTLVSIMRLPNRKDRLQKINVLDLTLYYKFKKPYSWKEWILFVLLRMRCFYLYDSLMRIK